MKIIDILRLIRKHIILLTVIPLFLAGLVILFTLRPDFIYTSYTTLYTGLATGSSVEMDKAYNFSVTSSAFDNLINVIKSREAQKEVAVRLLSQHLLLESADPKYISEKSLSELKQITPSYIYNLVVKNHSGETSLPGANISGEPDIADWKQLYTVDDMNNKEYDFFPPAINREDYELTVKNLTELMESSDTNFVYQLLNYEHPHYSIKALSTIKALRIGNSDLLRLDYEVDDPGICQQTLAILNEVCIRNYKIIRENRSDEVVRYFETRLNQSSARLRDAEEKLLMFNKGNNIINYSEQSRAAAQLKESLDAEYNKSKAQLAGIDATIKRLEEKLGKQQQVQLKNSRIIEMKKELGEIIYQIASTEKSEITSERDRKRVADLNRESEKMKAEIKQEVDDLYTLGKTTDGLPANTILTEWMNSTIEAENLRGRILVMEEQIKDYQKQYALYVPAGANIKRIEREITIAEQEFLENLHGLNQAKLKLQDNELASNIKAVDPPYYPLSPKPTNRKLLVVIAVFFGLSIVTGVVLFMEYFDENLNNPVKAGKILNLPFAGVLPKIFLRVDALNFPLLIDRLVDVTIRNIDFNLKAENSTKKTKTILVVSSMSREGKTMVMGNLARRLVSQGNKVLVLNYLDDKAGENMLSGTPASQNLNPGGKPGEQNLSLLFKLLGYPDPSIDFNSPYLQDPATYLSGGTYLNYRADHNFNNVKNFNDVLALSGYNESGAPDFVFIELPPLIYNSYPVDLIKDADMTLIICRSNRVWSDADRSSVDILSRLTDKKMHFILNGVELNAVESVVGELPRERSRFRRMVKALFSFQFFSKDQI